MKKLSTMLLASTLAVSMIAPVAAEGVASAKEAPAVKVEEVAKEAADKVKEEAEKVADKAKEEVKEVEAKAEDKKEEVKEDVKKETEKVEEKVEEAKEMKVKVSPQKVTLDGKEVKISGYNIEDENYFKLRDLAAVLKDTDAKFSVEYKAAEEKEEAGAVGVIGGIDAAEEKAETKDVKKEEAAKEVAEKIEEAKPVILLETKKDYKQLDTDLKEVKAESTAIKTNDAVKVDGKHLKAKAFKIDGNNYYRLRDLAEVLNFTVDYDKETNTVVLTSKVEEAKEEVKEAKKEEAKVEKEVKEEVKKVEDKVEEKQKEEVKEDKKAEDKKVEAK